MKQTTDVVIIGGGVIGCAIAYYLRKVGIDVIVMEREEIGSQASSAAAGLLAPLGPLSGPGSFADLLLASFALFPTLVPELEELSGIHLAYEQTGALRTVRNPKRVAHLKKRMDSWQPLGLDMQWLTGDESRRREPLLSQDIQASIYAPEESQIQAPQLVKAFARTARHLGASIHEHTEVTGIQSTGQENSRVMSVETTQGETIACRYLVIATGAWSSLYETWFGVTLPVSPQRGQIICFSLPTQPLRHILFGESIYLAPKGDKILVGATKEDAGFDACVTGEGIAWLRETAIKLVPALKQCEIVVSWAGLRPKTPDTKPILGKVPGWDNVLLATGHNSVGILLSAITGKTIAELIDTGHVPHLIAPFGLERFTAK